MSVRSNSAVQEVSNWLPGKYVASTISSATCSVESYVDEVIDGFKKALSYPSYSFVFPSIFRNAMASLVDTEGYDSDRIIPAAGKTKLDLSHYAGNVTVKGTDGSDVRVLAKNRDTSFSCKTTFDVSDNEIEVKTDKSFYDPGSCKVDLLVLLPKGMEIYAKVLKGSMDLTNYSGDLTADMGMGHLNGVISSANVNVKMGMGHVDLRWEKLPEHGNVDIKAGISESVLEFPKGSVIGADLEGGIGRINNYVDSSLKAGMRVHVKVGLADLTLKYADQ